MVILKGVVGFWLSMVQVDVKAMTATITTHAAVIAALTLTWAENVNVEEAGKSPALVSIDFSSREGGPRPKAPKLVQRQAVSSEPVKPRPSPILQEQKVQVALATPHFLAKTSSPTGVPAPAMGGKGQSGLGDAAVTIEANEPPPPRPVIIPISVAEASLAASRNNSSSSSLGRSGTSGSAQSGNGQGNSYKGLVYRHLLRHQRGNKIGSGHVLVAFAIGLVTVLCRSPISLCHLGFEREGADASQI